MAPVLEMLDIEKSFPGVKALQGVTLTVEKGEIHALLGENGAGKSTLMKILAGAQGKDKGVIRIDGQEVEIKGPLHARELGVAIMYQELSILPQLSVAENIFLGRLPRMPSMPWLVDWKLCYQRAAELLAQVGLDIDPRTPASRLKVADQQMVEIAKAVSENAKVVVMDEPTTSLTNREVETLFRTARLLQSRGVSIVYVSHRLVEVKEICNRATVLRDGMKIGTVEVAETTSKDWVKMMVGRDLDQLFPKAPIQRGKQALRVEHVTSRKLRDVSFEAYEGEILGIAGLVGAGRSTLARTIFGAQNGATGTLEIGGTKVVIGTPLDAIQQGVALVPEDRKIQGLVLPMTVRENITLAKLRGVSRAGQLNLRREGNVAEEYVDALRIATPHIDQKTANLSGGNQQKVVLAKWLYSDANILIIDEPTRGIDVGAKAEIYALLQQLVERGKTIIMISSELPELIGMSDRILVMHEGRIAGELGRDQFSEEAIMTYASGVTY
ncbi:sugar ABC transporter ATP-binding protein [Rhizobium rosettiformans]|uniref:sugar ABC transporter ATP-binding protein n=1 Tax=Rhizobium rosettiformans TaxID=1368430 RepID=UPI002857ED1F|nr:sugar ABC transporter ATP-binding protein [Rhizobium rosettiformans]MDR7031170.1 ribose transport system ATP-binding protein [Rhizobium rosettiformans]MDR7066735.1 ribose transport system ATP-binding protein [Rhizobium rosettiformans]